MRVKHAKRISCTGHTKCFVAAMPYRKASRRVSPKTKWPNSAEMRFTFCRWQLSRRYCLRQRSRQSRNIHREWNREGATIIQWSYWLISTTYREKISFALHLTLPSYTAHYWEHGSIRCHMKRSAHITEVWRNVERCVDCQSALSTSISLICETPLIDREPMRSKRVTTMLSTRA